MKHARYLVLRDGREATDFVFEDKQSAIDWIIKYEETQIINLRNGVFEGLHDWSLAKNNKYGTEGVYPWRIKTKEVADAMDYFYQTFKLRA